MHDKIKLARSRVIFSRLLGLCERQRQELEANPGPFIDHAYEELSRTRRLLEDVRWTLSGGPEIMTGYSDAEPIRSMASVLHERHQKVMDLISAMDSKSLPEAKS